MRNIFIFNFWNDDVCFYVWIYERKQFKLHVERCLAMDAFDLLITGYTHF